MCEAPIQLYRTEKEEMIEWSPFLIFITKKSWFHRSIPAVGICGTGIQDRTLLQCYLGLFSIRWFDTWVESLVGRTCLIKMRSSSRPTDRPTGRRPSHFYSHCLLRLSSSSSWTTQDENDTLPPGGTLIGPVSEDSHLPKCERKATEYSRIFCSSLIDCLTLERRRRRVFLSLSVSFDDD